ncbi:MAG: phytanoyl-CoA dioxygenase family protein [Candidatus Omnitrophica bacterium]|nr:phytanoyl-CoA dioxygenase family protein [Candidatus Omnitrophota bacterium]
MVAYKISEIESAKKYYEESGYVVLRNVIPVDWCSELKTKFESEIKPYKGPIYRQTHADPEAHILDNFGQMLNAIQNPLSVRSDKFPEFRYCCEKILASDLLFNTVEQIIGQPAGLVQSMYFESGFGTWPHQDSYYLDSEKIGSMAAVWIALEDIDESAGRFFICPGSHRVKSLRNEGANNIVSGHSNYKDLVRSMIESGEMQVETPALLRGDVLIWSALTVHGSHQPEKKGRSRSSLTAHFIPLQYRFLQHQCRPSHPKYEEFNGHSILRPKDQNKFLNRMILNLEFKFPSASKKMKKIIVGTRNKVLTMK